MTGDTYPRVYRFGAWALTLWLTLELLMIGGGIASIVFAENMFAKAALVGWGCGTFLVALGLLAATSTLRGKLVLYADRAEYTGILGTRVMRTAEVVSTRRARQQYGHFNITIVLKSGRNVRITDFGRMDDALAEWIDSFPNEEIDAKTARDERLLANPAFGRNPETREQAINADARRLNLLYWPSWALMLWGGVYPHPYTLCLSVLIVLPVIGLVMVLASRGRWSLIGDPLSGRLEIGSRTLILPAALLVLRGFLDDQMVDWIMPLVWAAGAAVALTLLSFLVERRVTKISALGFLILWFGYAWGGLLYVDTTFDAMGFSAIPVRVIDISKGDHSDTLKLSSWATHKDGNEASVSRGFSSKLHIGDTVCVYVHQGRLGLPWYEVDNCPAKK